MQRYVYIFVKNAYNIIMVRRDEKGKFVSGTKPSHVKQKGETNRVPKAMRTLLKQYSVEHFDEFCKKMSELQPRDYCRLYVDMLKYVVHALQAIQVEADESQDAAIELRIRHLAELAEQ